MECQCDVLNGWTWAASNLKDCVCNWRDAAGVVLGLVSVFCFGFSEVPQLIINWMESSAEAVSPGLMALWTFADVLDVLGCTISDTLPTMLITAWVYFIFTVLLDIQALYYGWWVPKFSSKPRPETEPLLSSGVSEASMESGVGNVRRKSSFYITSLRRLSGQDLRKLSLPELAAVGSAPPKLGVRFSRAMAGVPSFTHGHGHLPSSQSASSGLGARGSAAVAATLGLLAVARLSLMAPGASMAGAGVGPARMLLGEHEYRDGEWMGLSVAVWGEIIGWVMAVMFFFARVPQIILNWQRQSCAGLSVEMFVIVMLAGLTYCLSIVIRVDSWEDLRPKLPFMADAACGMLLDVVILVQFFIYRGNDGTAAEADALTTDEVLDSKDVSSVSWAQGHGMPVQYPDHDGDDTRDRDT